MKILGSGGVGGRNGDSRDIDGGNVGV